MRPGCLPQKARYLGSKSPSSIAIMPSCTSSGVIGRDVLFKEGDSSHKARMSPKRPIRRWSRFTRSYDTPCPRYDSFLVSLFTMYPESLTDGVSSPRLSSPVSQLTNICDPRQWRLHAFCNRVAQDLRIPPCLSKLSISCSFDAVGRNSQLTYSCPFAVPRTNGA